MHFMHFNFLKNFSDVEIFIIHSTRFVISFLYFSALPILFHSFCLGSILHESLHIRLVWFVWIFLLFRSFFFSVHFFQFFLISSFHSFSLLSLFIFLQFVSFLSLSISFSFFFRAQMYMSSFSSTPNNVDPCPVDILSPKENKSYQFVGTQTFLLQWLH